MASEIDYNASTISAKNQMDFQERMSNTAHQREVADLKAAGLNPVLSAGGSGASTPLGAEGDFSGYTSKLEDILSSSVNTTGKVLDKTVSSISKVLKDVTTSTASIGKLLNSDEFKNRLNDTSDSVARDLIKRWNSLNQSQLMSLGDPISSNFDVNHSGSPYTNVASNVSDLTNFLIWLASDDAGSDWISKTMNGIAYANMYLKENGSDVIDEVKQDIKDGLGAIGFALTPKSFRNENRSTPSYVNAITNTGKALSNFVKGLNSGKNGRVSANWRNLR